MAEASAAVAKVSTRAWNTPPTYAVMLGAVLGVGTGIGFLFFDWSSWGKTPRELVHSDSFVLWASLICGARPDRSRAPALADGAVSIWLIRGRLSELRDGAEKKQIELYIEFRSDLERLLGILGAIVGLAVLATAALRQVVLEYATHGHPNADFPADYPILYGLILSLVLALVYLPTYTALPEAGADLRSRGAPLPEPSKPEFAAAVEKRQTLTGLLGLDVSATAEARVRPLASLDGNHAGGSQRAVSGPRRRGPLPAALRREAGVAGQARQAAHLPAE